MLFAVLLRDFVLRAEMATRQAERECGQDVDGAHRHRGQRTAAADECETEFGQTANDYRAGNSPRRYSGFGRIRCGLQSEHFWTNLRARLSSLYENIECI